MTPTSIGSVISTRWSALRQAHQGSEKAAAAARQKLMERYCGAIYRYLLSAVRGEYARDHRANVVTILLDIFEIQSARNTREEILSLLLGPTGNLRAPTARVGKTLLVGFSPEAYRQVLGK